MNCVKAKNVDMVDYLLRLGFSAAKTKGNDYWYLSPFREERHASFKVDRKQNIWYDHGVGKGGDLVDFGVLYFGCSVSAFLKRLEDVNLSFQPPALSKIIQSPVAELKISIIEVTDITSFTLKRYLKQRGIPLEIAKKYCREVLFGHGRKNISALGFENDRGGWELRNPFFKGSTSPKTVRFLGTEKAKTVFVFEGFFSFLSWKTMCEMGAINMGPEEDCRMLVLNSLSFLERNRQAMEAHERIGLFLDRDAAGMTATARALTWSKKYEDLSGIYQGFKDLNEQLVNKVSKKLSHGRRL